MRLWETRSNGDKSLQKNFPRLMLPTRSIIRFSWLSREEVFIESQPPSILFDFSEKIMTPLDF